ncbi:hypothetical protein [Agrobacterium tumefaciens]|uniref:hypothetical protein n=1 Tax=Agrobacterium tumefaciens TaxID=358 RepID=UPI00101A12AE|nr:hypothetical protein [Agrobacterium tumefaciens]
MAKLPSNADIKFLVNNGLLYKPSDWLPSMYGNLLKSQKLIGPCSLRIGLSGTGHSPNYRIEPLSEPPAATQDEFDNAMFRGGSHPSVDHLHARTTAFSGRSHKKAENLHSLHSENWSSAVSTEDDIKALIKQVRTAPVAM